MTKNPSKYWGFWCSLAPITKKATVSHTVYAICLDSVSQKRSILLVFSNHLSYMLMWDAREWRVQLQVMYVRLHRFALCKSKICTPEGADILLIIKGLGFRL